MGSAPLGEPYSDTIASSEPPDSSDEVAYNREIHGTVYATYPLKDPTEASDTSPNTFPTGDSHHSSVAREVLHYQADSQTVLHDGIILPLSNSPTEDVPVGYPHGTTIDSYKDKAIFSQTVHELARMDSYEAIPYSKFYGGHPPDPTQRPFSDMA